MMGRGRLVEVSEWAILSLVGSESLDLHQRISTNDVAKMDAERAIQTVLTNEKGRIIEVVSVLDGGEEGVLVLTQGTDPFIMRRWIEKYVIMENITMNVLSYNFIDVMLYDSMESVGGAIGSLIPSGCWIFEEILASVGMMHIIAAKAFGDAMIKGLIDAGFVQRGRDDYEEYRVLHGIPSFPNELSPSHNPLAAGLLPLVSFAKGCYIGQQVIARLDTYKKVQRCFVQLRMQELPVELPETIHFEGHEWGTMTSAVRLSGTLECRGLGYTRSGSEATKESLWFCRGSEKVKVVVES